MPEWLDMGSPFANRIVAAAALLLLVTVVAYALNRRKAARYAEQRRRELRKQYDALHLKQQEIERLGQRIIATSSTHDIAGFNIIRQIEAVFTDGHASPAKAVEMLKAVAAQKGANAVINLTGERQPSGKCVAHGDAVIVQPLERHRRPPADRPEKPAQSASAPPAEDDPPPAPRDAPANRGGTPKD